MLEMFNFKTSKSEINNIVWLNEINFQSESSVLRLVAQVKREFLLVCVKFQFNDEFSVSLLACSEFMEKVSKLVQA